MSSSTTTASPLTDSTKLYWYQGITRQQWLALTAAFLGWVFDSMDANMYALVLVPSLVSLLHTNAMGDIGRYGGMIMALQLAGWAVGGIVFGIIADYIGRTRTMLYTILVYALFTGLSALSGAWWHLAIFRFLAGLGIGGEWASGVALIAETWPDRARGKATAVMQCAFGVGFFIAAVVNLYIGAYNWRLVFVVGILPAFITLFIRRYVHEPERWTKIRDQRHADKQAGVVHKEPITIAQLFSRDMIRGTVVGALLSIVALLGYYGSANWLPSWVITLVRAEGIKNPTPYVSHVIMMLTAGSMVGYLAFGYIADVIGRKWTFAIYYFCGLIIVPSYFFWVKSYTMVFWLAPVLGIFTVALPAGLAIYLPELFPTRVRATGQGFCFNAGRIISALGPLVSGYLVMYFGSFNKAAGTISLIFIVGLFVLFFAPETKGKPLPE
jgi:MFS family permease